MKNPKIAEILKNYRNQNKYTIYQVADKLKEHEIEVATKTIYGWESGQTQPDADIFLKLCDIYGIDNILYTFGYCKEHTHDTNTLSPDEQLLIEKYRQNPSMQPAVKKLLNI